MKLTRRFLASSATLVLVGLTAPSAADPGETEQSQQRHIEAVESPISMVLFAFDSARLARSGRQTLDQLAAWMAAHSDRHLVIEGHTDPIGTDDYNQDLGERRAQAVAQYLIEHGVPQDRIRIKSYGESRLVSSRHSVNRRTFALPIVELPVIEEAEPASEPPVLSVQPTQEQPPQDTQAAAEQPAEPARAVPPQPAPAKGLGMSVSVGGGVIDFVDDANTAPSNLGGMWTIGLTLGTKSRVALEAAYIGSAQSIDALGLDSDALLVGNGLETLVRFNLLKSSRWQPYTYAGLGYTHYELANVDVNTSDVEDNEEVFHVPLGAGLGFRYTESIRFDFRTALRAAFNDNLVRGSEADMASWTVGTQVSWEF